MFTISKKASNIEDEIEVVDYASLVVKREWYVHSGWFNANELVFTSSLSEEMASSYDSFIFDEKNVVKHNVKKQPNEEQIHLDKGSYRIEGSTLSFSLSAIVSIEVYEKKDSNRVLVKKPKKKILYDIDWTIIEVNDKRLRLHKQATLVAKELSLQ
jgi:hypothetical protein